MLLAYLRQLAANGLVLGTDGVAGDLGVVAQGNATVYSQ
jgi:hypothetical protein